MKREDTIKVLAVLKVAYPNFYKGITKQDANATINIWAMQFANVPVDIVLIAINKLIATNTFPPSISEVKQKLKEMYTEAVADMVTFDVGERNMNVLERIARHCRSIDEEPSIIAITSNISQFKRGEIDAKTESPLLSQNRD